MHQEMLIFEAKICNLWQHNKMQGCIVSIAFENMVERVSYTETGIKRFSLITHSCAKPMFYLPNRLE